MFGKKNDLGATNTIIGSGIKVEAAMLSGEDSVRIDGEYIGDIDLEGSLILGENGRITGNVKIKHALLAGKVEGNIICQSTVHISSSAAIYGNIQAGSLIIDEGAVFNGKCLMDGSSSTALVSRNRQLEQKTEVV